MPFTSAGAQQVAWALGSNLTNNYIQYFAIGIGSGTAGLGNVTLVTETGTRVVITGSPNFATARKVTFLGDFNSTTMSGVLLTEFGLFASGASRVGSVWAREGFPSITFDGTNELQLSYALEVSAG